MKLSEYPHFYLIEDVFPEGIVAGFSRNSLLGEDVPSDMGIITRKMGILGEVKLVYLCQRHSPDVVTVKQEGVYTGDGVFTEKTGIFLVVRTADCLPVFFFDATTSSVGIVHLGWRPALKGILDRLPVNLTSSYVVAGVGLRKCCFEVGEEFKRYRQFSPYLTTQQRNIYFDPVGFLFNNLALKGLKENRFYDVDICSLCGGGNFFSYRRNRTNNRTLSFIIKLQ